MNTIVAAMLNDLPRREKGLPPKLRRSSPYIHSHRTRRNSGAYTGELV